MASSASSVFSTEDLYLIRLRKMCDAGAKKSLHMMLKWVHPNWSRYPSFKEYLKKETSVSMRALNSSLKPDQKKTLRNDPQGDTYDVSLLFLLLLWGNKGLADKDDDVWHKNGNLEYLITAVKNVRNDLMHCYNPIDTKEFLERTEALRSLLKDMFQSANSKFNYITQTELDSAVQNIDSLINRIRDDPLDPMDITNYKRQLLFSQLCNLLKIEGASSLRSRHKKYSSLTPVSRLVTVNFPVREIFTDMVVREASGMKNDLELENLLVLQHGSSFDITLIVGEAGVGKTTLTKKLISDWTEKQSDIKTLTTYDLVLHAECREHIESFKGVLYASMPEIAKSFQGNDMVYVALDLKCLLIIDGLDELNKKTTRLFQEILKLVKDHELSVIVTSRPEAVERYFQLTRAHQIETRHIELLGIPKDKREEFVRKYHDGIEKRGLGNKSIDGLLKYLERTFHRLGYLWRSPYNLSILTILWMMKPDAVNSITTAPELHWEIHQLSLSKLNVRLLNNEGTQYLLQTQIGKKIEAFIYKLCREAIIALVTDNITLPQEAYQRLEDFCLALDIPTEEMIGAFLKRIFSDSGTRYSFPHKGLQDFLAALFIWKRLTAMAINPNIQALVKDVTDALEKNDVPPHVCQSIIKFTEQEISKETSRGATAQQTNTNTKVAPDAVGSQSPLLVLHSSTEGSNTSVINALEVKRITDCVLKTDNVSEDLQKAVCKMIEERFQPSSQDASYSLIGTQGKKMAITKIIFEEISTMGLLPEMTKFQNIFISLLGIFYMNTSVIIEDETKMEVLNLLQKSGIKDKNAWLDILNSVRCESYVAHFISHQPCILEGDITITDSTLFAYISLMQALKPLSKVDDSVRIDLDIKGDLTGAEDLLNLIGIHEFKVNSILINENNYVDYTLLLKSLTTPLKDPNDVNVDIDMEEDLIKLTDLMKQIKTHDFKIRSMKVKDCIVNDSTLSDFMIFLRALPIFCDNAWKSFTNLQIEESLTGTSEILQLMCDYGFKIRIISVKDKNIADYIDMLRALRRPMNELQDANFCISVSAQIPVVELLNQIRISNSCVELLSVKNCEINDANLSTWLKILESFPKTNYSFNKTIVDINIHGDLDGNGDMFKHLFSFGFKISKILVTKNNISFYASAINTLANPFGNTCVTEFSIIADEELENIYALLSEISQRKFKISVMKIREIQITDANHEDIASLLACLPSLTEEANQTTVALSINREISSVEELMKLIVSQHFKLSRIVVNDDNIFSYVTLLKTWTTLMATQYCVNLEICCEKSLLDVVPLLREIDEKYFVISSFSTKSEITDRQLQSYISTLKSLPQELKGVNFSSMELDLTESNNIKELLELLCLHKFRVERFVVTDSNLQKYTELLNECMMYLKDWQQVGVNIAVKANSPDIVGFLKLLCVHQLYVEDITVTNENCVEYTELLRTFDIPRKPDRDIVIRLCVSLLHPGVIELLNQITEKGLVIRPQFINLKPIRDKDLPNFIQALRSLPEPSKVLSTSEYLSINIRNDTPLTGDLCLELGQYPFPVKFSHVYYFRNPVSKLPWEDGANKVLERCQLNSYMGPLAKGMKTPNHRCLSSMNISIANMDGYNILLDFFGNTVVLSNFELCVKPDLPASARLKPLPGLRDSKSPSLYIVDVTQETVENAALLARRFLPNALKVKQFDYLCFPRAILTTEKITLLLQSMKKVKANHLVLPSCCKPESSEEEGSLQSVAKDITNSGIYWGKKELTHVNIDAW